MPPEQSEQAQWFAEHLQVHESMLRAWLHSRFPSSSDIDDIVQEAYLRVLQAHKENKLTSPKAYMFAIARNLALDHLRYQSVRRENSLVEIDMLNVLDEDIGIPEAVAHSQELELMTEAIQSLPDRCRQAFTLRKVYGMSQKDIAAQLGISEHTVSAQLTIAVHKCTEFFARYCRERK
jgi:RNA polymerase sigma-70 factor (ECF subfamily)